MERHLLSSSCEDRWWCEAFVGSPPSPPWDRAGFITPRVPRGAARSCPVSRTGAGRLRGLRERRQIAFHAPNAPWLIGGGHGAGLGRQGPESHGQHRDAPHQYQSGIDNRTQIHHRVHLPSVEFSTSGLQAARFPVRLFTTETWSSNSTWPQLRHRNTRTVAATEAGVSCRISPTKNPWHRRQAIELTSSSSMAESSKQTVRPRCRGVRLPRDLVRGWLIGQPGPGPQAPHPVAPSRSHRFGLHHVTP